MNAFHAFLFGDEAEISEQEAFDKIEKWFSHSPGITITKDSNPFTKANVLKITADEKYVTSFQFEKSNVVAEDYLAISNSKEMPIARVRVLMGPDENSDYDDVAVMVLQLLSEFTITPIYNVTAKHFIT
ncbi:MAG: hypothetical protein ABW092_03295 [Candidatus Thiodiazotropha sp.]